MAVLTLLSADLDDPSLSEALVANCLDAVERARASRYARPELARRFVAGRVLMRHILGQLLGVRPADVGITCNVWGKPEVTGGPFFNLSHAGRTALFAVDELAAIGVDIEGDNRAVDPGWFDAILSPRERFEFAIGDHRPSALLRLWVRKEAVVKAIGYGFSLAAETVDIGLHAVDVHAWHPIEIGVAGASRTLALLDLSGRDVAALARMGGEPAGVVRTASIDDFR